MPSPRIYVVGLLAVFGLAIAACVTLPWWVAYVVGFAFLLTMLVVIKVRPWCVARKLRLTPITKPMPVRVEAWSPPHDRRAPGYDYRHRP